MACGDVSQQAQALADLREDYAARSARCIQHAKDYAWPLIAKKWLEIYQ